MNLGYLQINDLAPDCKLGRVDVLVAGGSLPASRAPVYDPDSGAPVYPSGVPIDANGYVSPYKVDVSLVYDVYYVAFSGAIMRTRQNAQVIGTSAGVPGPQGPPGLNGSKGDTGAPGAAGANGQDGQDGTDGANGQDGVSLLTVRIDQSQPDMPLLYTLSNDPANELHAGSVFPAGQGLVVTSPTDTLGFLQDKIITQPDSGIEIVNDGTKLDLVNSKPETFQSQVSVYSTTKNYLSSLFVGGTGIDLSLTPDLNQIKVSATGTAVGGFYWKGEWDVAESYSINNAVWYFDANIVPPVNRLYIATAANQGIDPYEDTIGLAWSVMMIIDTLGDQFAKVSSTDSTPGYLADKLVAGDNITLETVDNAGVKTLKINAESADTTYTVYYTVTVRKGQPLYILDTSAVEPLQVCKADPNGDMPAMLIADAAYTAGQTGTAIKSGLLTDVNLLGMLVPDTRLYVAPGGGLTFTPPYEKAQIVGEAIVLGEHGTVLFDVDPSYSDKVTNSGVIGNAPTWTNVNNIVSMGACRCRLYVNSYYKGQPIAVDIPAASLTVADEQDALVCAEYNNGTPRYVIVDAWNFASYNLSMIVPVARFWWQSGTLHSVSLGSTGNGLGEKLALRQSQTEFYRRVADKGLLLSDAGSRNVSITGATVWASLEQIVVAPFTSATNSLWQMVKNAGVWTKSAITQWNNTEINDNAGLVTMGTNKYSAVWIYKSIGDVVEAFAVQHNLEYNTPAEALAAGPRSDVPYLLQSHCVLVGRIMFQKSAATGTVESAFGTVFGTSAVATHGNLAGLEGTGPEYQHINAAERAKLATVAYTQAEAEAYIPDISVRAASTANLATLSGPQTVDGIALVAGDYVLLKNQTSQPQNGVYRVNSGAWTRATGFDTDAEIRQRIVLVTADGTSNKVGYEFICSNTAAITVGTTNITFAQVPFGLGSGALNAATGTHTHTAIATTGASSMGSALGMRYTSRTATASTGSSDLWVVFSGSTAAQIETMPDGIAVANNSGRWLRYTNKATVPWIIRNAASNSINGSTSDFTLPSGYSVDMLNTADNLWVTTYYGKTTALAGADLPAATSSVQGAVMIEDAVTDGSTKAVTSNAVFDALAGKEATKPSISVYSTVNTWLNGGIFFSFPKSSQYQERTSHLRVFCSGGTTQGNQYTADVFVAIKVQGGVLSYRVSLFSGSGAYGRIRYRLDEDANWWYITVAAYVPAYTNVYVSVMDGAAPSSFTNQTTTDPTGLVNAPMDNVLFQSATGNYCTVETISSNGGYAGVSVPGFKRFNLMSSVNLEAFGLFVESPGDDKWMLLRYPASSEGMITDYPPPSNASGNQIATAGWVNERINNTNLIATFGSNQSGLTVSISGYIRVYSGVAITLSNSSAYEGQTMTFVGYNCASGSFTVNGVACNFPQYALKFVFLDGAWHNLI